MPDRDAVRCGFLAREARRVSAVRETPDDLWRDFWRGFWQGWDEAWDGFWARETPDA